MTHPQTQPAETWTPSALSDYANDPAGGSRRIVVLGASIGGLNAFSVILAALPADFPAPIVLVQHLSADFPSRLAQLLGGATQLCVKQAEQGDRLQAGHIYVAPPGEHLLVNSDYSLSLSQAPKVHHYRPSADVLFESVARSCGPEAIGVVLTGGDGDGSTGIRAIKAAGGVTIAQDILSSQQPSMPLHAAATGSVDFVLPLTGIAPVLVALASVSSSAPKSPVLESSALTPSALPPAVLLKIRDLQKNSPMRPKIILSPDTVVSLGMAADGAALARVQAAWQSAGQFCGGGAGPGEVNRLVVKALKEIDGCVEALVMAETALLTQNQALAGFQSDLREEQRRHQELLKAVSDAIIETDEKGVIRGASPAAAKLLGRSAGHMVGKPFANYARRGEKAAFERAAMQALAEGGCSKELALGVRGGLPAVNATASTARNTQGSIVGLFWQLSRATSSGPK